jgi:hypothetical protein
MHFKERRKSIWHVGRMYSANNIQEFYGFRLGNLDWNRIAGRFNAVVAVEIDQGGFEDGGFLL